MGRANHLCAVIRELKLHIELNFKIVMVSLKYDLGVVVLSFTHVGETYGDMRRDTVSHRVNGGQQKERAVKRTICWSKFELMVSYISHII